ncbi:unnamed protein product [Adineta steineri]|uniref:mitogen-activated protein kinase kinase n=1 Tax=Adineta steineri TaxID=433720 RepID=A0A820A0K3_9BILA|nr:unnamed protein product [Adineta steineri]
MATPQENLFVDANNREESDQSLTSKAINEVLCFLPIQSFGANVEATNLLTNTSILEEKAEISFGVATPTPTGVSPFNNHEIPQPSEEGKTVKQVAALSVENIRPRNKTNRKSILQNLLLFDVEEKQEPVQVTQYISKIPKNSTVFKYPQSPMPVDINQLHKCAKQIDKGRFGKVYSVTIKNPHEIRMAVKRIPFRTDENSRLSTYFELSAMEMIGSGNTPYIVDYYCSMIDIVVRALDFLKSKNIVHRDVKPLNILINKDGEIKLCDFGICRNLNYTQLDSDAVIGTGMYLPRESEKCAIQGDMWALGISLIEIIAGKHPFAEYESYGLGFKILEWEPIFPTTVSDDARAFILRLLRKEASERPRSYMNVINDSFICNMTEIPSDDEIDFIQHVIKKTNKL